MAKVLVKGMKIVESQHHIKEIAKRNVEAKKIPEQKKRLAQLWELLTGNDDRSTDFYK